MNVRMKAGPSQRAYPKLLPDKPSAIALPIDTSTASAANHDNAADDDEPSVNPLWMISVALAVLFGMLLILSGG